MSWLAWLIAGICVLICLVIWHRDVWRIMQARKSTVESAAGQLAACRDKTIRERNDPELADVLEMSEKIYRQAVDLYDKTRKRPWIFLPALLMGFHHIS